MTYAGGTEPGAEGQPYPAYPPATGPNLDPDPFTARDSYAPPTDSGPPPYPGPAGPGYPTPSDSAPYDAGTYPASPYPAGTYPAGPPGYPAPVGYGPSYPGPAYGYAGPGAPRNGLGTAALVLGILGVILCWNVFGIVLNILAVIFGGVGLSRAKTGQASNRGAAMAGLVLGIVGLALLVLLVVVGISFMSTGTR